MSVSPFEAAPPAFSTMYAIGFASKESRSFPSGASTRAGYAKIPP